MYPIKITLHRRINVYPSTKKRKLLVKTVITCCLTVLIACQSTLDGIAPTPNGAILNITISGVDEIIASNTAAVKRNSPDNTNNIAVIAEKSSPVKWASLSHSDVFTRTKVIGQQVSAQLNRNITVANSSESQRSSTSPKAAVLPLTSGVRYRLVIFNQDNVMVVNQIATTGTNPQIRVDGSRNYTWYALSLNEAAQVPDINASGIIAKANLVNKDVLYASGSLSAVDGNNYLNIVLSRLMTRFRVKLDVRGLFGTIAGSTNVSLLKNANNTGLVTTGDLNLRTGAFSGIERYPTTTVSNAQMTNVDNTLGATTKYADFYTLDIEPISANNLKVQLNRLDITLDDGTSRSFTTASTVSYSSAYTPSIGTTYELTLGLVEQPIQVGGIRWARTNLVYNANNTDQYRLKPNPGGSTSANRDTEYWNWMAATPTSASGNTDPCTLIYPSGTWRMPTPQEWQSIGSPASKNEDAGLIYGVQYAFVWNRDNNYPANPAYDTNNLFIAFGGYRNTSNNVTESPGGILLGFLGSGQCHYWTASGVSSTQAYAMQSSFSRLLVISWGDVNIVGANKSEGRNIRCVRQ